MDQWGVLTNVTNVIARDDLDSIKRKNLVRQIEVCHFVDIKIQLTKLRTISILSTASPLSKTNCNSIQRRDAGDTLSASRADVNFAAILKKKKLFVPHRRSLVPSVLIIAGRSHGSLKIAKKVDEHRREIVLIERHTSVGFDFLHKLSVS